MDILVVVEDVSVLLTVVLVGVEVEVVVKLVVGSTVEMVVAVVVEADVVVVVALAVTGTCDDGVMI